jgi:predicted MFS family arabinose efflux permease
MSSLLRHNRAFRRLWAAGAVSLVGDWLSLVAVATLAQTSGGGAFALALVFGAHALPGAVLAPVAGAIVDSFDRRRVLIAADAVASLVTVAMVVAALAGQPFVIAGLVLVRSAITSLVIPGESAALRHIVRDDELMPANAILAVTWSVAFVVGMALGGAAAMLGPAIALGIDAASFGLAAILHGTLPALPVTTPPRSLGQVIRATPRDTAVALRVAAGKPALLTAVLGKAPLALAGGAGWVSLNLIAAEAAPFGAAALSFGLLQAIRGAGTGIGPALASRLTTSRVSERRLQAVSIATTLAALVWLALTRSPLGLSIATLLWGVGVGSNWVLSHTSLQRHSEIHVLGRLAAFDELLVAGAMVLSAFIGAAAIEALGLVAGPLVGCALGLVGVATTTLMITVVGRRSREVPA